MFFEFQVSEPSVFTVLFELLLVLFMKIFVMVTFSLYRIAECQNWLCRQLNPSTSAFVAFQIVSAIGRPGWLLPFLFSSYQSWP